MGAIPKHEGDLLPPYLETPVDLDTRAPWKADLVEVVERFGTSRARRDILDGFLRFRAKLRGYGYVGFQWLDGSFLDVLPREPRDIDVVTFLVMAPRLPSDSPLLQDPDFRSVMISTEAKKAYRVDAHVVDLAQDVIETVTLTSYWYGLFSHQRDTNRWRGLVQVPLGPDVDEDREAMVRLAELVLGQPR